MIHLLAQRDNWERLGDRFSGDRARLELSEIGWLLLLAAGAIVLLWSLERLSKHFQGITSRPKPGRLFTDLCRAHQLNRSDRALLKRLAEKADVEHAAHLFVRADLFDAAVLLDGDSGDEVAGLRQRLFA